MLSLSFLDCTTWSGAVFGDIAVPERVAAGAVRVGVDRVAILDAWADMVSAVINVGIFF